MLGNFSSLERKVSQSFLSFSEILSVNYVSVLTNCQLGFAEVTSLEKTQVSYIFLIFSGSPDIIFLSLSLMQVITSAINSTVTFKILSIFLCSLIAAELIPIKVISA